MIIDTQQTVKQWLKGLAFADTSTDLDSQWMQKLLRKVGFPSAVVVVGIVYLDGKGTLEAPPTSIHNIAKILLQAGS